MSTPRTRRSACVAAVVTLAALVLGGGGALTPADAATKKAAPKKVADGTSNTIVIAELDAATATSHRVTPSANGVTALDDWEVPVNVKGASRTATVGSTLSLRTTGRGASGRLTGTATLRLKIDGLDEPMTVAGRVQGTYSCQAQQCTMDARVVNPRQPSQIIAILIGLIVPKAPATGQRVAEWTDILAVYRQISVNVAKG